MPKVSVIIPVYNTEPYLRRCLDSVVGQTLREIEIICVNDASPDNALEILREYAAKDRRVRIIDFPENRGVSAARNAGIDAAQGEYLGFVDSDDYVDLDFYEKLYERARLTGVAIAKGARLSVNEDGTVDRQCINDRIRQNKINFSYQFTTAIYKTTFIRKYDIDFPMNVTNNEDVAFLIKAVCLAPHIETIDDVYYHYYQRPGSANSKILGHAQILSVLKSYEDVVAFINARELLDKDYDALFVRCVVRACAMLSRGEPDIRTARACAATAISLYTICKRRETLDEELAAEHTAWHTFLFSGDTDGLAEFLSQHRTRGQLTAANLRARLTRGKAQA
jgi:glycosyltransferase involved in cell wall biosynthesis